MTRVVGVLAAALGAAAAINWLLGGGLLRLLQDVPVLWLLVAGLPLAAVLAIIIPDRTRTVRVPVYGYDAGFDPEEVHVHVHHHHVHSHEVTHHHVAHGTVTEHDPVSHRELGRAPMIIDGVVTRPRRAIGRGGE